MARDNHLKVIQKEWHGHYKSYLIGFFGSLLLTIISFYFAIEKPILGYTLVATLILLALLQATWQLIFFLHLGGEEKPRWMTYSFLFALLILVIIVVGSFWIMWDLNMRMMPGM